MRFSLSENPTLEVSISYIQNWRILNFLPKERSRMRVDLFVFPRDDPNEPFTVDDRKMTQNLVILYWRFICFSIYHTFSSSKNN